MYGIVSTTCMYEYYIITCNYKGLDYLTEYLDRLFNTLFLE